MYNDLDKEFLSTLGITTVESPAGFEQISEHSLTYCPGAEQDVNLRTWFRNPSLTIGSEIDLYYRNDHGIAYPRHIQVYRDDKPVTYEEIDQLDGAPDGIRRSCHENCASICEKFLFYHDSVRLPDLDANNQPFHRQFLYYRRPVDETDAKQDKDRVGPEAGPSP